MVCKNRGIYGFLGPSWVLITVAMAPVKGVSERGLLIPGPIMSAPAESLPRVREKGRRTLSIVLCTIRT